MGIHRPRRQAPPTCADCDRWLRPLDRCRLVCPNCGLVAGDELRAVGALARVFQVDDPYRPTIGFERAGAVR